MVLSSLQRDQIDDKAVMRCVHELRIKGSSFDMSKEPLMSKRAKSSSVEIE